MSDLPSIDDLIKKGTGKQPSDKQNHSGSLKISTDEVEKKFDSKMKEVGQKEKEQETLRFANSVGYPHISLDNFPVGHESLRQLPMEQAEDLQAVCFYSTSDEVRVGALDPTREEVQEFLRELEERNGAHGVLYVISKNSFNKVLKLYSTLPNVKPITKDIEIKAEDLQAVQADVNDFSSLQEMVNKKTVSDLLILLLGLSLKLEASDLHVEAEEDQVVIRIRLDGVLHDAAYLPKENYKKLVSRIKLVSSLKLNILEKPQDGRFTIKLSENDVDVRVSTMPTVYGENIVMRLLYQTMEDLELDKLGIRGDSYKKLGEQIKRPNGMIINTGPTGSGKTTTMYGILKILNKTDVKIITLEDPVEYKMEGVSQSQIDKSKDYTFARGLKSILRQDPDIAMVGEIRDLETAEIAVQAALTGHLILSTIHTNNAAGAIPRFLSMGVKPFLLAPALNCVIGQRLVRLVCKKCKEEIKLSGEQEERVEDIIAGMPEAAKEEAKNKELKFYQGKGCEACGGIGYKGRTGIHEVFVITPEIEQMILSGKVSEYEMEKIAIKDGMVTMVQDGVLKAMDGITTLEEIFRVIE
jgi:type IV pilus assembly protein PilB